MNGPEDREDNWELVSTYTRAEALRDGVLVDVTATAKEAGFKVPVAVTTAVWSELITPNAEDVELGQSAAGRLWDVIWMLRHFGLRSHEREVLFDVIVARGDRQDTEQLKAVVGAGDQGELVISVMLPNED